jgi:MFS family permease
MQRMFRATNVVLILLCAMYFISYIVRQSVSTAMLDIRKDFDLSTTQALFVFSVFGYPYLLFQIIGGMTADKFGPRKTLFFSGLVWAGATIMTGFATGLVSLVLWRVLMGFGVGATLPTATRAMQHWVEKSKRGFAQGVTHSFSRLGNALTPVMTVGIMSLAASYGLVGWRWSFYVIGAVGFVWVFVWMWYFRDDPKDHPSCTQEELATLPIAPQGQRPKVPWAPLISRMWPVTLTYFCYGWCLWLYLSYLPVFFKDTFSLSNSDAALFSTIVYFIGAIGNTAGGMVSDRLLHRTGNVRFARIAVTVTGFTAALLWLIPIMYVHDITVVAICLAGGFFFAESVIGPMWAIPMDIAPKFSGTASGLMNAGSALAAILSPVVAGIVTDWSGDKQLPFILAIGVLMLGAVSSFLMHPEKQFTEELPSGPVAKPAPAE